MIEAVTALLARVSFTSTTCWFEERHSSTFRNIFQPVLTLLPASRQVVQCRSSWSPAAPPQSVLESQLASRLGTHRVREALGQIRGYSPDRIQWVSKPGADVFGMTVAAVRSLGGLKMEAELTNGGIRLMNGDMVLDIAKSDMGECQFTIYVIEGKKVAEAALASAAADSIAIDLSSNFRSYSWSSSSSNGQDFGLFNDRMSAFGDMESLLGEFFGGFNDGVGHHPRQSLPDTQTLPHQPRQFSPNGPQRQGGSAAQELESMGVQVIIPSTNPNGSDHVDWSSLAGYEKVKSQIEESIILGLKHPSLFEKLMKKTRKRDGTNRPKVVLFQGSPGTGKTSTCKIIANETNIPMIHVPLESIVSKWFGESEKHVARIYELGKEVAKNGNYDGFILFIDEIDSLVSSRDMGSPHEASKRILSVLLRHIDGFSDDVPTMLICATNRPQDLDTAFINRVDSSIEFGLPDEDSRSKILRMYAKHLDEKELNELAEITFGLSGRNLKDLCQSTERVWTASVIRGLRDGTSDDEVDIAPPPLSVYLEEAKKKLTQQTSSRR